MQIFIVVYGEYLLSKRVSHLFDLFDRAFFFKTLKLIEVSLSVSNQEVLSILPFYGSQRDVFVYCIKKTLTKSFIVENVNGSIQKRDQSFGVVFIVEGLHNFSVEVLGE